MPLVTAMSARGQHAQLLTDSVLARPDCLERIDELVQSAAVTLGADLANLSMSTDCQVTVSRCTPGELRSQDPDESRGMETVFEDTICANALRTGEQLAIPDARIDARTSSIPAVRDGMVTAYLGSPLKHEGAIVGVLCVVSAQPRTWSAQETATLDRFAADVLGEVLLSASAVPTV